MVQPGERSIRNRRRRGVAAALLVGVLVLAGCSSDGGSDADDPTTTVARDGDGATTTTTEAEDVTTTTVAGNDPTTTEAGPATTAGSTEGVPGEPGEYTGAVDGQDVEVSFTRTEGAVTDFTAAGVTLDCQPLDEGEASTTSIDVVIAEAPIGAEGSNVDFTDEDSDYQPTLTGSFTPEGSFAGALYLSGERDGAVCGAELTFIATAG